MRKITSLLLCLAMTIGLSACFTPTDKPGMTTYSETTAASTASETTKKSETSKYTDIVIMSTTDMHGKCWETNILTDNAQPHNMLRVSTAVKETRDEYGSNNVILIDNGDLFQGTPVSQTQLIQYGSGESKDIPVMALCLKEIGYDVFSPGNHEFNYPWETMEKVYQWFDSQGVNVISGNICYDGSDKSHNAGDNVFEPYSVKTVKVNGNDHKIGILGLENCDIGRWDLPVNYPGLIFVHPDNKDYSMAKEAEKYISQMKDDGCEFIIVSYHGGLGSFSSPLSFGDNTQHQGKRIIEENKDIGLLITGHDHSDDYSNTFVKDAAGKDVLVVNGGGEEVTKSIFRFTEDNSGKLQYEFLSSENLILDDFKADGSLKDKVAPYAETAEKEVSKPVGKASGNWDGSTGFMTECTDTINLICAAEIEVLTSRLNSKYKKPADARADIDHLDVDLVITTDVVAKGYTIKPGDITYKDLYKMYKFSNTLFVIPMSGKDIKAVMEENATERLSCEITDGKTTFRTVGDSYTNLIFGGLNFEYDLSKRDGSRVSVGKFSNGRYFKDDSIYLVAVNNYILGNENCGLRNFSVEDAIWSQLDDTNGETIHDVLAEYISSKTAASGSVTPNLFTWHWSITYSGSTTAPDTKNVLAIYEKDPQNGKKYILYHESSGNTITSNITGTGLSGAPIPLSGDYLTGDLPAGALEFTLFYDENFNFTLRDQYGNFLVSSPTGGVYLTNQPVEDRYQFWRMEKASGGWNLLNIGGSGNQYLMYSSGFYTGTLSNTNAYVFNFYEVG